jgi:beta-glucosidase
MLAASTLACAQATAHRAHDSGLPFLNPALPLTRRVDDLVGRMTLEEKVSQMVDRAPAIPRLGIVEYNWGSEALHGIANDGYATVFPQSIALAATWDVNLMHRVGEVISTEGRAKYVAGAAEGNHELGLDFWAPNVNLDRDPRWGRGEETYGEDPYLSGQMAMAFVTGMQGDDPKYLKVISTPKHFAVHSGPEPERHRFNVNVSPHDLEDSYLPQFRSAIVDGHADSVMCAYNAIDGTPACANSGLLQGVLRRNWRFNGYVVSDCSAISDIATEHKFTPTVEDASVAAVRAGTDLSCDGEYRILAQAVHEGKIRESEIDAAVKHLMTARFRLGMFDPPSAVRWRSISADDNDTAYHRKLALEAARESIVLLKNENGTLPLGPSIHNIAVIGPNAAYLPSIEGNYHGQASKPVTPFAGMRAYFSRSGMRVLYAQGSSFASGLLLPVPPNAFFTDERNNDQGLRVEYFRGNNLDVAPVASSRADYIDADWQSAAPVPDLTKFRNAFTVRYTGYLQVPAPGDYIFRIDHSTCDNCGKADFARIFIDEKPVGNDTANFSIHFSDTQAHRFRLEYTHVSAHVSAGVRMKWMPPTPALLNQAVAAAAQSDVIVAFMGLSPDLEGESMDVDAQGFSGGDRTAIDLPAVQAELLESLAATGKPLVVVLMSGSAVAINWANRHASAILEAWYPGEDGGKAIAETLGGDNNPSGKLPITFYASLDDLPPFTDYSMKNRTYRYFTGTPLYSYGYGLSYSHFEFANLKLPTNRLKAGEPLTVECDIANTSKVAGDEVAELYLKPQNSPTAPLRSLAGFARVHVAPGKTNHLSFTISSRSMSQVLESGERVILPGTYSVFIRGSSQLAFGGLSATFMVDGRLKVEP